MNMFLAQSIDILAHCPSLEIQLKFYRSISLPFKIVCYVAMTCKQGRSCEWWRQAARAQTLTTHVRGGSWALSQAGCDAGQACGSGMQVFLQAHARAMLAVQLMRKV